MDVVTTIEQVRAAVTRARDDGARIGFVPTMGALHAGHLRLVHLAAEHADQVAVSIFVNPTQFDRPEDLDSYPRDLDADLDALAAQGAATPTVVFAPTVGQMYPRAPLTTVHVTGLTERLCGARRPGHFDGVATVVTKLFNIVRPDVAVFGRKDRQQLAVVQRLVGDLDLGVEVLGCPTVRDDDGLAVSSRNRLLDEEARREARAIPAALTAGVRAARAGRDRTHGSVIDTQRAHTAARTVLDAHPGLDVEYLEVVDPDTFAPAEPRADGTVILAVAAFVDGVRLIDNVELGFAPDEAALLDCAAPHTGVDA